METKEKIEEEHELQRQKFIELNSKPIEELTLDEIIKLRRLLFRKNIPSESKKDHVKQIFSTLNFKTNTSTYQDDFYFSEEKKESTLHPDLYYHYLKSFMKSYEEEKMKHKNLIRK
jgi:hypothetical protein